MWPALFLTSNHSHIRQLQFATQAFSQKVLQQAVQISICQWFFRVRGAREKISVSGKWKFGKYVLKTSHNKEHYF